MKVCITGATGFIGKLLVKKHVDLGDEVHILSRRRKEDFEFQDKVQFHYGDLSNVESLKGFVANADILYHCAAEIRDESKMREVNVKGTENLIQAASKNIKHWVQLSSVGVYGPVFSGNIDESQPYNPINEYERTKLESDFLVIAAAQNNVFTFAFIRPSNVFGSEMRNASLFQLIKTIEKGFYFFVGSKGASANYVPVENVIEALYLAGTHPKAINEIYNISSWDTIENFIGNIADELGKSRPKFRIPIGFIKFVARVTSIIPKNPLTVARVNALSNRAIYTTTKIEKELSYKPPINTDVAVRNMVRFYKKNSLKK